MIIRKPFAFLVEKFKLLHFIVLIPCIYLIYMFWRVSSFFSTFVVNGYVTTIADVQSKYYSFLMVIASLLVIIFASLVTSLFKKKNKFYMPYLLMAIVYVLVFVTTLFLPGLLRGAEAANLESSTSLIIRGVMSIMFYSQIIFSVLFILLAFGFDIRTGDFLDIKEEINLDENDSEEVEINIKSDDYKAKRFARRYSREIKYYVIENKNIFKVLGIILGLVIVFFIGKFIISLNRNVKVDQTFGYSNFNLSFNSSILSTLDYNGNVISKGKIYLANKVTVTNKTNAMLALSTYDFCLETGDNCYYPKLDRSGKFLDLAKPYYAEQIGRGSSTEYVLVYELDESLARSKYKIKVLDSLTYKKDAVIPKYKEITLTPSYSDSVNNVGTYSLGDELDFSKTNLLNSKLKVTKANVSQYYRYYYYVCKSDDCDVNNCENEKEKCNELQDALAAGYGKYFIIMDGEFTLDENSSYSKYKLGSNDFFEDFTDINYKIGDVENTISVKDATPKKSNGKIILEVNSVIKDADTINLIVTIRNQRFTLKLK